MSHISISSNQVSIMVREYGPGSVWRDGNLETEIRFTVWFEQGNSAPLPFLTEGWCDIHSPSSFCYLFHHHIPPHTFSSTALSGYPLIYQYSPQILYTISTAIHSHKQNETKYCINQSVKAMYKFCFQCSTLVH